MSVTDRAAASSDPDLYLAAYDIGRTLPYWVDTDARYRRLLRQDRTAEAAGFLEGLALARRAGVGGGAA